MRNQIYEYCKELRLSSSFADNALTLTGDTCQEYMLKVLRAELDYRTEKRKKLHLKQAGFDVMKTFEDYDFNKIIIPNSITLDGIRTLDFMIRKENLILYGRNGAGKSHMATALGVEACMQGKKVKFYKTTDPNYPVFGFVPGKYSLEFALPMDYNQQFEDLVLKPLNRIVEILGYQPFTSDLCYVSSLF